MYAIVYERDKVMCIIRKKDLAQIPLDFANSDYQQYLAWLALGNTPEEWQPDIVQSNETP